ncbi:hypothetical protein C0992_002473 [Termitomyces sp. T32_za158]|nr:hypothetical protein C0992_002473 [Termitomyces sp. T32_za158]
MAPYVLQESPKKGDTTWVFTVPEHYLRSRPNYGKLITFTADKFTLQIAKFPENRILRGDDPSKFILLSFGNLRFPDSSIREGGEYIERLLKAGLFLNGVQYRFYHHSNSQLASTDKELDDRIYSLGDYGKIMNIAKRAKRIGLLFSEAQLDWQLDPQHIGDIPDIKSGDEVFSDGCGLMSKRFATQVSSKKRIIFRGVSYLGYKGVLMLHPDLDKGKRHLVEFRKSMKKFSTTRDITFSLVNFSKPYTFGRLNNDVIVLLSSLGITNDKLRSKQQEYFEWIRQASIDPIRAIDFLFAVGEYTLAEDVLLKGLDDPEVSKKVRKRQVDETAKFKNEKGRSKAPIFVRNSRRLFGVCDPYQVLKEGQVHIRIMTARAGPSTPIHGDVIVELNALHSQSVDGAQVKIPDRLTNPPERTDSEPYILDILEADRSAFADEFLTENMPLRGTVATMDNNGARDLLVALLQSQQSAVSEYELFNLVILVARKHNVDIRQYLNHLDMSALSAQEKHALSLTLDLSANDHPYIWNSLIRSDILTPQDLYRKTLNRPFSMQRLYSSKTQGLTTFFEFLRMGTQEYTRKLLVLKVRLSSLTREITE